MGRCEDCPADIPPRLRQALTSPGSVAENLSRSGWAKTEAFKFLDKRLGEKYALTHECFLCVAAMLRNVESLIPSEEDPKRAQRRKGEEISGKRKEGSHKSKILSNVNWVPHRTRGG